MKIINKNNRIIIKTIPFKTLSSFINDYKKNGNLIQYKNYVDKYESKKIVSDKYKELVVKTLGVYDDPSHINFDELPEKYMIKCTGGSGRNIIVKNGCDKEEIIRKCNKWLKTIYRKNEEPQYNFNYRIIIEEFIEDIENEYRLYCFDGICKFIDCKNKKPSKNFTYFKPNWEKINIKKIRKGNLFPNPDFLKPEKMDYFVKIAEELCKYIPFVTFDLFETKGNNFYFSEFTFSPSNGRIKFFPHDIFKEIWYK